MMITTIQFSLTFFKEYRAKYLTDALLLSTSPNKTIRFIIVCLRKGQSYIYIYAE